jgi:phage shock protein PspC (stress-responsive transcriptional regulator)
MNMRVSSRWRAATCRGRLKGQWFFGVCRGLAEAAGLPVAVFRVGVIALLLVGKIGWMIAVPLYFLLDMSLEVHPEDRRLLLRFRFRRWLDSLSALPARTRRRRNRGVA